LFLLFNFTSVVLELLYYTVFTNWTKSTLYNCKYRND